MYITHLQQWVQVRTSGRKLGNPNHKRAYLHGCVAA